MPFSSKAGAVHYLVGGKGGASTPWCIAQPRGKTSKLNPGLQPLGWWYNPLTLAVNTHLRTNKVWKINTASPFLARLCPLPWGAGSPSTLYSDLDHAQISTLSTQAPKMHGVRIQVFKCKRAMHIAYFHISMENKEWRRTL